MGILEVIVKLRDDLKEWVTTNLIALNTKLDNTTADMNSNLLSHTSNDMHISAQEKNALNAHIINNDMHITSDEKNIWNNKAEKSDIPTVPTKVSRFENDAGYLTALPLVDEIKLSAAYEHSSKAHAPSNAQKNSDITKAEIEAKLVGEINSHTHAQIAYDEITDEEIDAIIASLDE